MATIVNMHQAKSQLSKLVERALAGEEIIVARAGKPAVKLVAVDATATISAEKELRPIGLLRGQIWIAPDFDDPLPEEILEEFYSVAKFERHGDVASATRVAEAPMPYGHGGEQGTP